MRSHYGSGEAGLHVPICGTELLGDIIGLFQDPPGVAGPSTPTVDVGDLEAQSARDAMPVVGRLGAVEVGGQLFDRVASQRDCFLPSPGITQGLHHRPGAAGDDVGVVGLVAFVHGAVGDNPHQLRGGLIGHVEIGQLVDTGQRPTRRAAVFSGAGRGLGVADQAGQQCTQL
ncbi:hypothetical protein ACFXO9_35085 [Nocardia tengchongensis]|uniref:hypothetical protein n=1 Tax=Nocardia tengchongensis TaxID=2055889 RepID=UPI0036994DA2